MAKFQTPQLFPSPIPEDRFAQNDDLPSSSALRRSAWAFNHAAVHQRKQLIAVANTALSTPAPASVVETNIYFCFRTGENVESIGCILGQAPASATSGSFQAACILKLYNGSSTYNSKPMYYPNVAAGTYQPSDVAWNEAEITTGVLPNTVYVGMIEQDYYSRVHSVMVYEKAANIGSSANVGVCNPLLWEANRPIYDAGIQDLAETGTKLWQHNGSQLISWSRRSQPTAPSISSTTYVNALETGTTAWSASAPGVNLNTIYHNTAKGGVPVELGVRAIRTSGTGTLDIRLVQNGVTVLTRTGIDQPSSHTPCDTSAHTILAHGPTKTDIMAKVSSGAWRIDSIGLWEYEA